MGRPRAWAAAATGRPAMLSPGRPPAARREHRQRFWQAVADGFSSEDAGVVAGVSPAVGTRWFREGGGMRSVSHEPLSGRYLSFAEREELRSAQDRAPTQRRQPTHQRHSHRPRMTTPRGVTDPALVAVVWDVLSRAGSSGGRVLEPGCGSGTFIGHAPHTR